MRTLTVILLGLITFCKSDYSPQIERYIDFIATQKLNAKEYIFKLWETNDIVIICERGHPEITQYDLFIDIISDSRFYSNSGIIFTEVGTISISDSLNAFIKRKYDSEQNKKNDLLEIYRHLIGVDRPIWDKYNYYYFLNKLNSINSNLSDSEKINLYSIDCPSPMWDDIISNEQIRKWENRTKEIRDSIMATNIIQLIQENERFRKDSKYLIILNNRHAFSKDVKTVSGKIIEKNTARFIFDNYPDRVANVFLNWYSQYETEGNEEPFSSFHPIQNGKWDAAFKVMEIESVGFDLENTPFGLDTFDFRANHEEFKYQDLFTGMIFYKPIDKHLAIWGIPEIVDNSFRVEFYRRNNILYEKIDSADIEKQLNRLNQKNESKIPWVDRAQKEINKWIE